LDTKASRKHHRRTASNAKELLTRLNARAANARADNIAVLTSFDVGNLSKAYKRWMGRGEPNPAAGLDGYSWAKKAISMRGQDPSWNSQRRSSLSQARKGIIAITSRKEIAGAKDDPLLAPNLISAFNSQISSALLHNPPAVGPIN
jgi:hypothetical protein